MSGHDANENIAAIDTLFKYLEKLFYDTANAKLDIQALPPEFRDLGEGLEYFGKCVSEVRALAKDLSTGNLNGDIPPPGNELAAPLKMLHASLRHLTWQSQQVAKGDYSQRVDFMGDFSSAFNNMTEQLEKRWKTSLDEKYRLQMYVNLIMENAPDPILLIDNEKRLAYASKSYLKLFGLNGQPEGKYIHDMLSGRVPDKFLNEVEDMLTTAYKESRTLKTEQFIDLGGSVRHYQLQISPMSDLSGTVEGLMIMFHDTTDLVRANEDAEKARRAAEKSSHAKSEFLSRMSHEMRTPMNSILGMASIYGNEQTAEGKDYCINKINDAAKHLLGIIEDILDATNIDSERFELYLTDFNLIKILNDTVDSVRYKANECRHTLTVNIADNVPQRTRGDRKRLAQVLSNLLLNAIKFTPPGGKIALDVSATDSSDSHTLHVRVTDNGVGVDPDKAQKLFTAFEQVDGGVSRKYGGTGLGLAISKHIVELMNGKIWVTPREGGGSVFGFDIPLTVPLTAEKITADYAQIEGIFNGRNILAAEDVPINAEVLSALLSETGAEITIAEDGAVAVDKFLAEPQKYDLILMDINMPNMDGYEAAKRIRAAYVPRASFIPIIAMTANIFKEDIERCFASGMNAHLAKPLDPAELIETLKDFLL